MSETDSQGQALERLRRLKNKTNRALALVPYTGQQPTDKLQELLTAVGASDAKAFEVVDMWDIVDLRTPVDQEWVVGRGTTIMEAVQQAEQELTGQVEA